MLDMAMLHQVYYCGKAQLRQPDWGQVRYTTRTFFFFFEKVPFFIWNLFQRYVFSKESQFVLTVWRA